VSRALTSGVQTEVAAEVARATHLIELQFTGGTIRLTTAPVNVSAGVTRPDGSVDGPYTFSAIGGELSFGEVAESGDFGGSGTPLKFSAVNQTVIAAVLLNPCVGCLASVWRCHFDATWAVVASPTLLVCGYLNEDWLCEDHRPTDITETPSATIETRVVDLFGALNQVRGIQSNLASHQSQPEQPAVAAGATLEHLFKFDTFFQYVAQLPTKRFQWGDTIFAVDMNLPLQQRGGLATSGQRGVR
jgi:hypothetical protein